MPMRPKSLRRPHFKSAAFERTLFLIGVGLAITFSIAGLRAVLAERRAERFETAVQTGQPATGQRETSASKENIIPDGSFAGTYLTRQEEENGPGRVVGELRMPALDLAVPILSGIADRDLSRGAGHIPGSGNAGGLGNMAVAGHRDTFFRPLRRVRAGMVAVVSGSSGSYRYQVDRTEIVAPEQLKVLDIGDQPQLTLITCYPFDFIGPAPNRFVVFAHLISAAPDPQVRQER